MDGILYIILFLYVRVCTAYIIFDSVCVCVCVLMSIIMDIITIIITTPAAAALQVYSVELARALVAFRRCIR